MATAITALCDNAGGAVGKFTTLSSCISSIGTTDLTSASTVVFSHSGVVGTINTGSIVRKSSDTSQTATIALLTSTKVMFRMDAGDSFSNGDTIEVSSAPSNYIVLSSASDSPILIIEHDNFASTSAPSTSSITANSTNYMEVRASSGNAHSGKVTSGARLSFDAGAYNPFCVIQSGKIFSDFIFHATGVTNCIAPRVEGGTLRRCVIKCAGDLADIKLTSNSKIYSCLVYESTNGFNTDGTFLDGIEIYGTTVYSSSRFMSISDYCVVTIRGCLSHSNTNNFAVVGGGVTLNGSYNATDEAVWTYVPGGSGGTGNQKDLSTTASDIFKDPGNDDYSLATGATGLHTAWSASPNVLYDVLNVTRPSAATASIGAFEYVSTASTSSYTPILNVKYKFTHSLVR